MFRMSFSVAIVICPRKYQQARQVITIHLNYCNNTSTIQEESGCTVRIYFITDTDFEVVWLINAFNNNFNMSIGGKGSFDTEFLITFRFCDIFIFFFFPLFFPFLLATEKLSNFSKNFLLHFGIREKSVVWAPETTWHLLHKMGNGEFWCRNRRRWCFCLSKGWISGTESMKVWGFWPAYKESWLVQAVLSLF